MFVKNVQLFLVFLSLLFNIQVGFSHDIEHINHEHEQESLLDCEDCSLKHHLDKTVKLSNTYNFDYLNHTNLNDNYLISNNIVYTFVAYQSRAP